MLKHGEINYISTGLLDKSGRVFEHNGKIYRVINKNYEKFFITFLNSDLYKELEEKGYVPITKISDLEVENFGLVLEHERLLISQPSEWTFLMLKEAALFLLDLNKTCKKHSYRLYDGHFWNVAFKNNRPIFVDFGSFIPLSSPSCFDEEFLRTCVYPLILYCEGEGYIASALLSNPNNIYQKTIPENSILNSGLITSSIKNFVKRSILDKNSFKSKLATKIFRYKTNNIANIKLFSRDFLEKNLIFQKQNDTMWDNYQNDFYDEFAKGNLHKRFERFALISNYIKKFAPDCISIVDLAGNQGGLLHYLEKNNHNFEQMVNIDYDEYAISNAYLKLRGLSSQVNNFLLNIMLPRRKNVAEEFKSDIALALALTHHLLLSQHFNIEAIFESIKSFSNKYVFIEFMPWGLWHNGETPEVPEWYNENWFECNFKNYFDLIHKEDFGNNRMLFIGKIKTP